MCYQGTTSRQRIGNFHLKWMGPAAIPCIAMWTGVALCKEILSGDTTLHQHCVLSILMICIGWSGMGLDSREWHYAKKYSRHYPSTVSSSFSWLVLVGLQYANLFWSGEVWPAGHPLIIKKWYILVIAELYISTGIKDFIGIFTLWVPTRDELFVSFPIHLLVNFANFLSRNHISPFQWRLK